jgi:hypothetical protein
MYILTMYQSELTVIGHLNERDWNALRTTPVERAFAV